MEEKKERKAVAKKLITPNMQEWKPVSPKMPEKIQEAEESVTEEQVVEEQAAEEPVIEEATPVIEEPAQEEPHSRVALSDNKSGLGMGWYVVHTY